jgi:hypothetical protein
MTSVAVSDESERRVAEALSAHASGAPQGAPRPARPGRERPGTGLTTALLIALLGGAALGCVLALISLLAPGVLPPLG